MNNFTDPYEATDATLNPKTELPLVWLLPIIALVVSGWLIYKSVSEKGPVITISFPSAEGLEIDKTKIKYLGVDIGKVSAINIDNDLKTIRVSAQMNSDTDTYLKQGTRFWVVKPQVGLGGISGLGTLLSGPYIAIKPGEGNKQRHFNALDDGSPIENPMRKASNSSWKPITWAPCSRERRSIFTVLLSAKC